MAKLVSDVYGDALFELAMETDRLDSFLEEAKDVLDVLSQNQELSQMMNHPKISKDDKLSILDTVFKGQISDELIGLMRMVVEKNHFADMSGILNYFVKRVYEQKNIGIAYVSTPMELTDTQKADVVKKLLETTKYVDFNMNYAVDSDLIGGMVIRIGDRVVDSSVKSKLASLARELSQIQLKVGECAP